MRYVVTRVITESVDIDEEDGEAAIEVAKQISEDGWIIEDTYYEVINYG